MRFSLIRVRFGFGLFLALSLPLFFAGCYQSECSYDASGQAADGDTDAEGEAAGDGLAIADGVDIVIPESAGAALTMAANDMAAAFNQMTASATAAKRIAEEEAGEDIADGDTAKTASVVVSVSEALADELGKEGYKITAGDINEARTGLHVEAATEAGAMYGLYRILRDMDVFYIHPEETYIPDRPNATLPTSYTGQADNPRFEMRGFHEHTQHPIPMSDILLKPGNDDYRKMVSNYLKWLARNRQNTATFHLLKTIDMDAWLPYVADVIEEAHTLNIKYGVVTGFADHQQNAFKLIPDESQPEKAQIEENLDMLLAAGFDYIGLQIGTSEFTKPTDEQTITRMNTAVDFIADNYPEVEAYAWIHVFCGLEAESGGYFYHLPLEADEKMGAFVHTTMFYTLHDPAPVYACEDFTQQEDFMKEADGERNQVFFPESAWWLGFDNNAPVVLPITGYSRGYDINEVLPDYDIKGHVTFTTGREWTYWQYDHFLTMITWDKSFTWEQYLKEISVVYAGEAENAEETLKAWTDLQVKHFYEENPEIYFYVAGELGQDEIGQTVGIVARRPKIAYQEVVGYDDEEFDLWKSRDFDMLTSMLDEYQSALEALPASINRGTAQEKTLYNELYKALYVYTKRIEHAIALYSGVISVREWDKAARAARAEDPPQTPSEELRQEKLAAANARLAEAQAISQEMLGIFTKMEEQYRYPVDILAREKESLTAYDYGYLWETSTGHFWTRRDAQLQKLIDRYFQLVEEEWENTPDILFYADKESTEVTEPVHSMVDSVIGSFIPVMLFGVKDYNEAEETMSLIMAQDYNENWLPDFETEALFEGAIADGEFQAEVELYTLAVHNNVGDLVGSMNIINPSIRASFEAEGEALTDLTQATLTGVIRSQELIDTVTSVVGGDGIDEEGIIPIVKMIWSIPSEEALPETLPIAFSFAFKAVGE